MEIRLDDLKGLEIARLLQEHLRGMFLHSPPESVHALPLDALRALKELDPGHGEVKSMRTVAAHLRKGVGSRILETIMDEARRRSYLRLSLETGSQPAFAPARALYARFGFLPCGPFGAYVDDPNSFFMTRVL